MDPSQRSDLTQSVHRSSGSFELVLGSVVLALLGLGLDTAVGVVPVFTITFAVVGFTGACVSIYYRYRHQMAELGAKRS